MFLLFSSLLSIRVRVAVTGLRVLRVLVALMISIWCRRRLFLRMVPCLRRPVCVCVLVILCLLTLMSVLLRSMVVILLLDVLLILRCLLVRVSVVLLRACLRSVR